MPDARPLISVVLPTHNRAHCLARAMRSVLDQSWPALQLLVVDDASTDDTAQVVAAMADKRIRYLRLDEQQGAANARNAGIEAASGAYIAFQDSDDLWLPGKLEVQMACLQETGADMVFSAFHRCREDGSVYQTFPHAHIPGGLIRYEDLLFENLVGPPATLATAALLKRCRFDTAYPALQDWELALRAARDHRLVYLPQPLVEVTLSPDSLSRNQEKALAALRMLFAAHKGAILASPKNSSQWLASLLFAGRASHTHVGRDCLALLSLHHPPVLNARILWHALRQCFG